MVLVIPHLISPFPMYYYNYYYIYSYDGSFHRILVPFLFHQSNGCSNVSIGNGNYQCLNLATLQVMSKTYLVVFGKFHFFQLKQFNSFYLLTVYLYHIVLKKNKITGFRSNNRVKIHLNYKIKNKLLF